MGQPLVCDDNLGVGAEPGLYTTCLPLPEYNVALAVSAAYPLAIGREPNLASVSGDGVSSKSLVSRLTEVVRAVNQDLIVERLCREVLPCNPS